MKKEYQVTIFCAQNKYKPVSAIIKFEQIGNFDLSNNATYRQKIIKEGMKKICFKRRWTTQDLKKFGYVKFEVRAYDKAKIERENAERYEKIKEEKYASGEWKRPKKALDK